MIFPSLGLTSTRLEAVRTVYLQKENEAYELFDYENNGAIRLQKMWRGKYIRKGIYSLRATVDILQDAGRRFLSVKKELTRIAGIQKNARTIYYNAAAIKIQKIWRGYRSRSTICDMHARRKYVEGLKLKMDSVRIYIDQQSMVISALRTAAKAVEEQTHLYALSKNKHHLVGTSSVPGVYQHGQKGSLLTDEILNQNPEYVQRVKSASHRLESSHKRWPVDRLEGGRASICVASLQRKCSSARPFRTGVPTVQSTLPARAASATPRLSSYQSIHRST